MPQGSFLHKAVTLSIPTTSLCHFQPECSQKPQPRFLGDVLHTPPPAPPEPPATVKHWKHTQPPRHTAQPETGRSSCPLELISPTAVLAASSAPLGPCAPLCALPQEPCARPVWLTFPPNTPHPVLRVRDASTPRSASALGFLAWHPRPLLIWSLSPSQAASFPSFVTRPFCSSCGTPPARGSTPAPRASALLPLVPLPPRLPPSPPFLSVRHRCLSALGSRLHFCSQAISEGLRNSAGTKGQTGKPQGQGISAVSSGARVPPGMSSCHGHAHRHTHTPPTPR